MLDDASRERERLDEKVDEKRSAAHSAAAMLDLDRRAGQSGRISASAAVFL